MFTNDIKQCAFSTFRSWLKRLLVFFTERRARS